MLHPFLWPKDIPLYGYTTISLSSHPLMDIRNKAAMNTGVRHRSFLTDLWVKKTRKGYKSEGDQTGDQCLVPAISLRKGKI